MNSNKNLQRQKIKGIPYTPLKKSVTTLMALLLSTSVQAQINFDSAYDLESDLTGQVLGHAPGIRTALSVDNPDGELRVCSQAKVNYQILDVDGDWDRPFREDYREGTQDSITWWFEPLGSDKRIQVKKATLGIDTNSITDQTVITLSAYIQDAITGEIYPTEGGTLSYQIQPYTSLETSPDTSSIELVVNDITKAYFLQMADKPGYFESQPVHEMPIGFIETPVIVPNPNPLSPGVPAKGLTLDAGHSFIKTATIKAANSEDCYVDETFTANITDQQGHEIDDFFEVAGQYRAEVKLNGKNILQTQLIDRQIVWHLFSPVPGSSCDVMNEDDRTNSACFVSHFYSEEDKFEDGTSRVQHHFNSDGELEFSEFFTQKTNKDAAESLQYTQPNFSEQGYFVGISLINK